MGGVDNALTGVQVIVAQIRREYQIFMGSGISVRNIEKGGGRGGWEREVEGRRETEMRNERETRVIHIYLYIYMKCGRKCGSKSL